MRTRRSNKDRHFYEGPASDDEGNDVSGPRLGRDDDDFEAAESEANGDEDDEMIQVQNVEDEDEDEGSFEAASDDGRPSTGPRSRAPTTSREDPHRLPVYPVESRYATRVYTGALQKHSRYGVLRDIMYGPDYERVKLIWALMERWIRYPVLPPAYPPQHSQGLLPSPWLPSDFESEQEHAARQWYEGYRKAAPAAQVSHVVREHGQRLLPQSEGDLITLLGPWNRQKEYRMKQGDSMVLSQSGLPLGSSDALDESPSGWIFDTGGLIVALDWAPTAGGDEQILALAVIPQSDQLRRQSGVETEVQEERTAGSIQFWEFTREKAMDGQARPAREKPSFILLQSFDWGRPKKLSWCPVPIGVEGTYGMLAVLCGDGQARVIEVKKWTRKAEARYEDIEHPVATIGITDEYQINATCLTWIGTNRIALGHSDGSITLWSVYPTQLLQRHAVHSSYLLDISSGYPSYPYLVASVPTSGCVSMTDLTHPSAESTYVAVPSITFQPGLLGWIEHMQGWAALYPTSGPGVTALAFLHVKYFAVPRTMGTLPSQPMCVGVSKGGLHPYVLLGSADGSLWGWNALSKLFKQRESRTAFKIEILEHEFQPTTAWGEGAIAKQGSTATRGAARIVQGFLPKPNEDPRTDKRRRAEALKAAQTTTPGKKRGRPPKKKAPEPEEDQPMQDAVGTASDGAILRVEVEDTEDPSHFASRLVIHEPQTRVTAVAWNPNLDFGCWTAVALGSGLVRVLDLGVD